MKGRRPAHGVLPFRILRTPGVTGDCTPVTTSQKWIWRFPQSGPVIFAVSFQKTHSTIAIVYTAW